MKAIVSGPQNPGPLAQALISDTLARFDANNGIDAVGTGCARGVDTIAALEARDLFPNAEHHLFIPAAPSNVAALKAEGDVWVEHLCQRGRTDADSYGIRNATLCEWAHGEGVLLAFPANGREVKRSGTWWTIRIAGRMHVPCVIHPLDGSRVERLGDSAGSYFQTTIEGGHHA